nr:PDGF/VEGF receptor-like protein [Gryllodes sigillatus]
MGSKTPVSILQEMMARQGNPPTYELIFDGSGTHTTVFKYRVTASNVTAIGVGRSKKEAKHEAARMALERLATHQIADVQPPGLPREPVEVVTPYKDQLKENAIGALLDMCTTNEIPMPEYYLIEEKGAPHEKIFTFVCSVSKQKEIGIGRTKKQAKQLAAFNMMNRLKESLSDVLKDVQNENFEHPLNDNLETAASKYVATVGTPRKKIRLNRSPYVYHNFFSDMSPECLQSAWEIVSKIKIPITFQDVKDFDVDWISHLDKVLECLCVQKSIVSGRPMNGNETIFLQINHSSEAVFYGSGDCQQAVQQAAYLALLFLHVQLRPKENNWNPT